MTIPSISPVSVSRGTGAGFIQRGPYAGRPKRALKNKSLFLDDIGVQNIVNALAYADHCKLPLNCSIDVVWKFSRWRDCSASTAQTAFCREIRRFLKKHGIIFCCIWTREVGPKIGPHTHMMMYIPVRLVADFIAWITRPGMFERRGFKIRSGLNVRSMRAGKVRYIAKNIDPNDVRYDRSFNAGPHEPVPVAAALGIVPKPNRHKVDMKRCGTTESIGKSARKSEGWRELTTLEELGAYLNPPSCPKPAKASRQKADVWHRKTVEAQCPKDAEKPRQAGRFNGMLPNGRSKWIPGKPEAQPMAS